MGRVYLALTPAGRPVALKVVRPDLGGDAEFRRRFRQEVDAARRVHGMYTAQVLDVGPDASPPWLVTAYVPGPSLQQAVAGRGPMPEQTVFALLAGVAEALAAIHAVGIVHRDLKPSNVLLAPDGPRVIDFGIARAADSTVLTGSGMLIGSPSFMAPEQVKGQAVTQAADVFALGAVAVFAATGRLAFGDGADMGILYRVTHEEPDLSRCPPRLREVVGRCLAKDPAARPSPADIIATCRVQSAGQAGGIALPWLPPDVLAALAQHAPPPQLPSSHVLTQDSPGRPPARGGPGDTGPHPARRAVRTRAMVFGGALAIIGVAALAVFGVLALRAHGGKRRRAPSRGFDRPFARCHGAGRSPRALGEGDDCRFGRPAATSPPGGRRSGGASLGRLSVAMCRVADMALEFPLPQARHHLDELVARAHQDHERIVLTEHGKPTAVLISVAELDELQYAQDLADIALCEAIKTKNEAGLPHEVFMAALDAEDPGQPGG